MTLPGPLQIVDWIRANLHRGVEPIVAELQALSDKCESVGLPDVTTSILVTSEVAKHWKLKPPAGYSPGDIELWKRLPYKLARVVSERSEQNMLAVRRCQNLNALLRKHPDRCNAVVTALLENEGKIRNARN